MKLKNKYNLIGIASFCTAMMLNLSSCFAVTMEEYTLKGTNPEVGTYSSAPAYTISDSPYFPDGTILYKQTYNNVTYYAPKPPENSVEANGVSAEYKNWGFWDFSLNQKREDAIKADTMYRTNEYYSKARLTKKALVYGCDSKGNPLSGVYLEKGTVVNVKSITIPANGIEYVYFDTSGTGVYSFNNIARIESEYVEQASNDYKKVYFDEVKDRSNPCSAYYDNFRPYKTVLQRYKGSAFDNLELSTSKVPTTVTKCSLGGKSGEWKYLGVSSKGNVVTNPYFPGFLVGYLANGSLAYYDWRKTPWDASDTLTDERKGHTNRTALLKDDAEKFKEEYDAPTFFDLNYRTKKVEILQKIIDDGVQPVNGGLTPVLSASQWADRLTLLTNPYDETPIFVGQRREGYYSQPFAYVAETNDLYLSSIVIKDYKGSVIASGTRKSYDSSFTYNIKEPLKKAGCYTVEVKVSKKINAPLKASRLYADLQLFSSLNTNEPFANHNMSLNNKGGLVQGNNTSGIMLYHFVVPEDFRGNYYKIKSFVSPNHTGIDNLDYSNDSGLIQISVTGTEIFEQGDIKPVSIKLLDGTTVVYDTTNPGNRQAIIPGKKYKIVYTAQYVGDSLYYKRFDGTNWVNDTSRPYKSTVPLSYSITRKVGNAQSNDGVTKTAYFVDSANSTTITMAKDKIFTYTINDVMLEHPYLDTSFTITSTNKKINKDTTNDNISVKLNDGFDIVISNLRVLPNKEYTLGDKNSYTYNVIYDAKLTTPSYITSSNYKTLINTSININGTQKAFVDLLKPNTVTKNISHSISGVSVGENAGPYYAEVVLNYDKKVYENGGYENNRGVTSLSFEKVKNPSLGNANDKAKAPYNGANTSPDKGGDANNNCLVPRNTNTYKSTYSIYNWNATNINYTSFSGANSINFYKYNISSEQTKTTTNTENFVIKDVLFRSKYTKDKELGAKKDGWVSMVNSKDSIIKAGYGFELKVIVEYKTNALLNNPVEQNNTTAGTFVTNLNSGINITPEIFVEIPGTKEKTILSVNKYTGTKQGLSVKQTKKNVLEGSMQVSEWEYTIKGTTSNGVQGTGKIFIPENLKDGDYKLSIYTPPVSGVSSSSEYDTFKYSSLCDRKDTNVTVNGSATDDLNSHTTQ